jgi:hypothetical protein
MTSIESSQHLILHEFDFNLTCTYMYDVRSMPVNNRSHH